MAESALYVVTAVNNYGGFFGGEAVDLVAAPFDNQRNERGLVIEERSFTNVTDRYLVLAGMVLRLRLDGDEVREATLLGGPDRAALRQATKESPVPAGGLRVRDYRCPHCQLWVSGGPEKTDAGYLCALCRTRVG